MWVLKLVVSRWGRLAAGELGVLALVGWWMRSVCPGLAVRM